MSASRHDRSLSRDQRGLSTLEYVVLFVIMGIGALVAWGKLGRELHCHLAHGRSVMARVLGGGENEVAELCNPDDGRKGAGSGSGTSKGSGKGQDNGTIPGSGGGQQPPPAANSGLVDPGSLPATAGDAPQHVQVPAHVSTAMQNSYAGSFPGGQAQERGATLVKDAQGNIHVVNERSGTAGTMQPDRNAPPNTTIVGTYHTHPYDQTEGGHQGVGFSGADIGYAAHYREPILVDAGTKQFMMVPSKKTNATPKQINTDWNAAFQQQLQAGKTIQDASKEASVTVAKKYDMAYYEGTNGSLSRISP